MKFMKDQYDKLFSEHRVALWVLAAILSLAAAVNQLRLLLSNNELYLCNGAIGLFFLSLFLICVRIARYKSPSERKGRGDSE